MRRWKQGWLTLGMLLALSTTWSPGPVIGPGGYLGAAGRGLLEMHFAKAGAYLMTLSLLVGGLLLSTEYFLPRLAVRVLTTPRVVWRRMRLAASISAAARTC